MEEDLLQLQRDGRLVMVDKLVSKPYMQVVLVFIICCTELVVTKSSGDC